MRGRVVWGIWFTPCPAQVYTCVTVILPPLGLIPQGRSVGHRKHNQPRSTPCNHHHPHLDPSPWPSPTPIAPPNHTRQSIHNRPADPATARKRTTHAKQLHTATQRTHLPSAVTPLTSSKAEACALLASFLATMALLLTAAAARPPPARPTRGCAAVGREGRYDAVEASRGRRVVARLLAPGRSSLRSCWCGVVRLNQSIGECMCLFGSVWSEGKIWRLGCGGRPRDALMRHHTAASAPASSETIWIGRSPHVHTDLTDRVSNFLLGIDGSTASDSMGSADKGGLVWWGPAAAIAVWAAAGIFGALCGAGRWMPAC